MLQFYSDESVSSPLFTVLSSLQQWQAGSMPHLPFCSDSPMRAKGFPSPLFRRDGIMEPAHLL